MLINYLYVTCRVTDSYYYNTTFFQVKIMSSKHKSDTLSMSYIFDNLISDTGSGPSLKIK